MSAKAPTPYGYFDTPDGQDVVDKLLCVWKPAALTTFAVGTCDVMLYSKPKGYLPTIGRYAWVAIPIMGMSTAFVMTSNMLANWRKKDDAWNWVAAGALAGMIFGAWKRCPEHGGVTALFLGGGAGIKKELELNGYRLNPDMSKATMHGGAMGVRHDWSLLKDVQGEWKSKFE